MLRLSHHGDTPDDTIFVVDADCVLGRSPDCDVVLDATHVSARHARIAVGVDDASLADLGSTNGTTIVRGEERIPLAGPDEPTLLCAGDVIELGRAPEVTRLLVAVTDDDGSAQLVRVKPVAPNEGLAPLPDDALTLRALYAAQSAIGRAARLDTVLAAIAAGALALVPRASHVAIVLDANDVASLPPHSRRTPSYVPVLTRVRGEAANAHTAPRDFVPVPRSVFRRVLNDRAAVLAADVPAAFKDSASLMGARVRSSIAVPLWQGESILGVLQVDNRATSSMLTEADLDAVLVLAESASLAVHNARLVQRLRAAEDRLRHENAFLRDRDRNRRGDAQRSGAPTIIGESSEIQRLLAHVDRVADTNVTVLIEGETGTGKELVASALHHRSRRREGLFVALNCAALAESLLESELFGHRRGSFTGAVDDKKGLFELADGSTLFLDEITEAPSSIQSKLLRVLQEGEIRAVGSNTARKVNVRVVAATNRDLEAEVRAGRFREDLYYRLKVFPLRVPPLRERREDIRLLAAHILERACLEFGKAIAGLTPETLSLISSYDWPGNVRELENELQRVVIQANPGAFVTPDLLTPRIRREEERLARSGAPRGGALKDTMAAVEKHVVLEALREHGGNKTSTARALGITREGLHKKLRQLGS